MNILAAVTSSLPPSTGAVLLGIGCFVLGIFYIQSQVQIGRHLWLRLLLSFLTLESVLLALGRLFWPVNGLVFTLAAHYSLFQSAFLPWLSLMMGAMGIGYALTFLSLIGWKLLSNSQGPTRLKLRNRWWFRPFLITTILLLAQAVEQSGLFAPLGSGIVFIVSFHLYGAVGALDPQSVQWVDTLYQGGLRKIGYVLTLVGIVIFSVPYLAVL